MLNTRIMKVALFIGFPAASGWNFSLRRMSLMVKKIVRGLLSAVCDQYFNPFNSFTFLPSLLLCDACYHPCLSSSPSFVLHGYFRPIREVLLPPLSFLVRDLLRDTEQEAVNLRTIWAVAFTC